MKGEENKLYHETHCAFCGKGIFWALLLNKVVVFKNGWVAHKKCYEAFRKGEKHET